jgi:hypothetical protein
MADEQLPPPCPACGVKRAIVRMHRWPWRRAQWWRCYGCFTKYQAHGAAS